MRLFRSLAPVLLAALVVLALSYSNAITQTTVIGTNLRVNAQTATTYTFLCTPPDNGKLVTFNNSASIAVVLPWAGHTCFRTGWYVYAASIGAGTTTITPATSTIGRASSIALAAGTTYLIISDGTNYQVLK